MQARRSVRVLVIIVNYRSAQLTLACLRSLRGERAQPELEIRVVVIENDSGDLAELQRELACFEGVTLISAERNGGFSYGNNLGFRFAYDSQWLPDYFHLLNPDTRLLPGGIAQLVQFLECNPRAGIAGSKLQNADGTPWPYAFRFPTWRSEIETGLQLGIASRWLERWAVVRKMKDLPTRVDWIPGASMLVRRTLVEQIGGLDEQYFLYYEETDFCLKAQRQGWECWYVPQSQVVHLAGQSTGVTSEGAATRPMPDYWFESRARYFRRNHGYLYAALASGARIGAQLLGNAKRRALGRDSQRPGFVRGLSKWAARDLLSPAVSAEKTFQPERVP